MKRKDLTEWESDYGGTTAEGIAKRVINQYSPSSEELSRTVTKGRGAGKKADGTTEGKEEVSSDAAAKTGEEDRSESESRYSPVCCAMCFYFTSLTVNFLLTLGIYF